MIIEYGIYSVAAVMLMAAIWTRITEWAADRFISLRRYSKPAIKRTIAHWLMASAAGDDARDAAVAAAMRQVVKLEVQDAG